MSEAKILGGLGELYAAGITEPKRTLLSLVTGYPIKSLNTLMGKLKKNNFLVYPSGQTVRITPEGLDRVPSSVTTTASSGKFTNKEMQKRLKSSLKLKLQPTRIFDLLVDGKAHSKKELAMSLGLDGSKFASFKTYLSSLGGMGLVSYPSPDTVQLADLAFPFGRPSSEETEESEESEASCETP
jgi:hypothetical protein